MNVSQLKHQVVAALAALSLAGTASAEASLPADYIPLDWIASSTGAEYIDSGYVLQPGEAVRTMVELEPTQPTQWSALFGCRTDTKSNPYFTFQPNYGSATETYPTYKYGDKYTTRKDNSFPTGVKVSLLCKNETASWTSEKGEESIVLTGVTPVNYLSTLLIFNQNGATTVGSVTPDASRIKMKLYSFEILAADGETVSRNYVPCRRKSDRVAGLYETEEGKFWPNSSKSGCLFGSDDVDLRYSYVQLAILEKIDTGYTHQPDTTVEAVVYVPDPSPVPEKKYAALFGACSKKGANNMGFFPWNDWQAKGVSNAAIYERDGRFFGYAQNPPQLFFYDTWVKLVCDAEGASWWALDKPTEIRHVDTESNDKTAGVCSFYIGGFHTEGQTGTEGADGARFRSFRISETSGVKYDYYPMRLANGSVGFYDTVAEKLISTVGTYGGVLHTVSPDDATISVYEGTLAPVDIVGRTVVEKKGFWSVDATAVTSYPSLALCNGTFSLQDGTAATCQVKGTLKLVGGARVAVDVTAKGSDSFSVTDLVDLSEATESNPFVFSVALVGDVTLDADGVTLISSGCTAGDEAKVVVDGTPLVLSVRDGALVAVPVPTSAPATARWTGDGDRTNLTDAANWVCKTIDGTIIPEAIPTEETAITVPSEKCSFNWPKGATIPCKSIKAETVTLVLAENCDWTGLRLDDPFFDGLSIDLNGHTLTLSADDGESAHSVAVTDGQTGGKLVIDVPQGAEFVNTKIALSGSLQLVKTGAGTFVAKLLTQTYSGGTQIMAGTFMAYNDTKADSTDYALNPGKNNANFGAEGSTIRVEADATFDINGIYDLHFYSFVANGGRFVNSKMQNHHDWGGFGNLLLEADSRFDLANSTAISYEGAVFDLNGHTLTVSIAPGKHFYHRFVSVSNGTFAVTGGGVFDPHWTDSLNLPGTTLDLGTLSGRNNTELSVSNLITRYAGTDQLVGKKTIHVTGAFKPMCDRYPSVTLHNGAAIDLSEQTNAWKYLSALGNTPVYASDVREIVIDIGARKPAASEQLVAWSDIPSGIRFTLKGEQVTPTDSLSLAESGIFFSVPTDSPVVVAASWTGDGGDNSLTNPANWTCWNACGNKVQGGVPSSVAIATFEGSIGFDFKDAALPWQGLRIASCSLTRDCDWRGLGDYSAAITEESTIDLCGHKLFVIAPSWASTKAMTVTDSTMDENAPGEFHFSVAENATFTNEGTLFTGNVRLVKEGAGVYTPQRFDHTYSGGTVVAEGTVKLYNDTVADSPTCAIHDSWEFKYPYPLGKYGSTVTVKADATFDINGVYNCNSHNFVIEGGAFANSKAQTKADWTTLGNVVLTSNSIMRVNNSIVIGSGPFDLGGKVLDAQIAKNQTLYLGNGLQIGNGTVRTRSTSGVGVLQVYSAKDARTVDFDIGTKLDMKASLDVHDYTANAANVANSGTAALNVWGTFRPLALVGEKDYFYGCTLQNGSTLDLSGRTVVWKTTSDCTGGANEVTFAANATITVNLAGREIAFPSGEHCLKIIDWETNPPDSTTKFKLDAETRAQGYSCAKREDGLYLSKPGFMILVY